MDPRWGHVGLQNWPGRVHERRKTATENDTRKKNGNTGPRTPPTGPKKTPQTLNPFGPGFRHILDLRNSMSSHLQTVKGHRRCAHRIRKDTQVIWVGGWFRDELWCQKRVFISSAILSQASLSLGSLNHLFNQSPH